MSRIRVHVPLARCAAALFVFTAASSGAGPDPAQVLERLRDYRPVRIGDGDLLLPAEARQFFFYASGYVESVITFSSCREYRAESRLVAEVADDAASAAAPAAPPPAPVDPAGLPVSISLTGAVSSATAAAGDPLAARLAEPLVDQSGNVIAPAGARVRGRVVKVERKTPSPQSVTIRLALETIEIGGRDVAVRLAPARNRLTPPPPRKGVRPRGILIGDLPRSLDINSAEYNFAAQTGVIKDGARSNWVTVEQP